jgi:hypothetical protein
MRSNRKVMATYHSFAQAEALDDRGGRFAVLDKPAVTGSSPTPMYPQMPDGPWKDNPYPEEPLIDGRGEGDVLGYRIDDMCASTVPAQSVDTAPSSSGHVITPGDGVRRKGLRRI